MKKVIFYIFVYPLFCPKYRTHAGMFVCGVIFAFGVMFNSVIGYLFNTWENMVMFMGILPFGMLIIYPVMPESFRWYYSTGKLKDGEESLR